MAATTEEQQAISVEENGWIHNVIINRCYTHAQLEHLFGNRNPEDMIFGEYEQPEKTDEISNGEYVRRVSMIDINKYCCAYKNIRLAHDADGSEVVKASIRFVEPDPKNKYLQTLFLSGGLGFAHRGFVTKSADAPDVVNQITAFDVVPIVNE